ncbi:suppressor of fused domain protein [Lignipirellula cremea]|uniref:Ankyrin repeats (3 copies) n=1 Tax=Lignipirellula cremea TaxID=2528010 RepID=A0A518DR86_9BACT|nr:suppressor of fused domain protein [Lignipirellula cremea]QDU94347.1 Ankyrin repeats (3 copies) [Lignipirellula cremea]
MRAIAWSRVAGPEYNRLRNGEIQDLAELITQHFEMLSAFPMGSGTLLHAAAAGNCVEALEMLVATGLEIDQPNKYGNCSPLEDAASAGSMQAAKWLLDRGAAIEGIGAGDSATPLIRAAKEGHLPLVKLLVGHGADINASYLLSEPFNALKWSIANGQTEVEDFLRKHGAKLPEDGVISTVPSPADFTEFVSSLSAHLSAVAGPPTALTLTEIVPSDVPISILAFPPWQGRDSNLLCTAGMSAYRMAAPVSQISYFGFAELFLQLPANWPLDEASLLQGNASWPIHWLKTLARLPFDGSTCYGAYKIVTQSELELPAPNTDFYGALVLRNTDDYGQLVSNDGISLSFYDVIPLFKEECELIRCEGIQRLADALDTLGIDRIANPSRKNAVI